MRQSIYAYIFAPMFRAVHTFFTIAILEKQRHLLTEHINDLRSAFRQVKVQRPFNIEAIVILPDHLHYLCRLPPNDVDYSTRWRLNKSAFSQSIAPQERLSARRQKKHERGIWQRRFLKHFIRDQRDFEAHTVETVLGRVFIYAAMISHLGQSHLLKAVVPPLPVPHAVPR